MNAWIVCSGDELVDGRVVDTNGPYLAREISSRGVRPLLVASVPDDEEQLADMIVRALTSCSILVLSGGLGGTRDDITRQALSRALDSPLKEDPAARDHVLTFWKRLGRKPAPEPWPEALVPVGATVVTNTNGLAPGLRIDRGDCRILALPGVPGELHGMVSGGVLDDLCAGGMERYEAEVLVTGIPESHLADLLGDLLDRGRNPLIGIGAKELHIVLHIGAESAGSRSAEALVNADLNRIQELVAGQIVSIDGRTLPEVVAHELMGRQLTIAVAESLTGGLVTDLLTSVPGISSSLLAGVVAYSNEIKQEVLGVGEDLINRHGAVSEPVAEAMARGIRQLSGADVAVATTGIAGPTGGTPEKPVGTAFVAVHSTSGGTRVEHRIHGGDRGQVKIRVAAHALDLVRRVLFEDQLDPPRPTS